MGKVLALSILAGLAFSVCGCHPSSSSDAVPTAHSEPGSNLSSGPSQPDGTDATLSGGEGDPRGDQSVSAARGNDTRPLLVCFGDSLTAGYGTGPGESYPDYLQADLARLHYNYRVVNEGISGDTTKDGVQRLPGVLAMHAAVVVVEFGGNDGLRGLPIEESRANLDSIVHQLKASGAQVVLAGITLPPDYGPDYIRQFDETYTLLAKKYRVPMLPFLLKNVYGVPGMMQRDETHATAKGNQIVARNLIPLLLPLLKK